MASEYLKNIAETRAKKIDLEYGSNAYGGTNYLNSPITPYTPKAKEQPKVETPEVIQPKEAESATIKPVQTTMQVKQIETPTAKPTVEGASKQGGITIAPETEKKIARDSEGDYKLVPSTTSIITSPTTGETAFDIKNFDPLTTVDVANRKFWSGIATGVEGMAKAPTAMASGYAASQAIVAPTEEERQMWLSAAQQFADTTNNISLYNDDIKNYINKTNKLAAEQGQPEQFITGLAGSAGEQVPSMLLGNAAAGVASAVAPNIVAKAGLIGEEATKEATRIINGVAQTVSLGTMYGRVYSNELENMLAQGYDVETANRKAFTSGVIEVGTEMLTGGMPGVPGSGLVDNAYSGLVESMTATSKLPLGAIGNNALAIRFARGTAGVWNFLNSSAGEFLSDAVGEGLEEWISEFVTPYVDRYVVGLDTPNSTSKERALAFLGGAIMGAVFNGVQAVNERNTNNTISVVKENEQPTIQVQKNDGSTVEYIPKTEEAAVEVEKAADIKAANPNLTATQESTLGQLTLIKMFLADGNGGSLDLGNGITLDMKLPIEAWPENMLQWNPSITQEQIQTWVKDTLIPACQEYAKESIVEQTGRYFSQDDLAQSQYQLNYDQLNTEQKAVVDKAYNNENNINDTAKVAKATKAQTETITSFNSYLNKAGLAAEPMTVAQQKANADKAVIIDSKNPKKIRINPRYANSQAAVAVGVAHDMVHIAQLAGQADTFNEGVKTMMKQIGVDWNEVQDYLKALPAYQNLDQQQLDMETSARFLGYALGNDYNLEQIASVDSSSLESMNAFLKDTINPNSTDKFTRNIRKLSFKIRSILDGTYATRSAELRNQQATMNRTLPKNTESVQPSSNAVPVMSGVFSLETEDAKLNDFDYRYDANQGILYLAEKEGVKYNWNKKYKDSHINAIKKAGFLTKPAGNNTFEHIMKGDAAVDYLKKYGMSNLATLPVDPAINSEAAAKQVAKTNQGSVPQTYSVTKTFPISLPADNPLSVLNGWKVYYNYTHNVTSIIRPSSALGKNLTPEMKSALTQLGAKLGVHNSTSETKDGVRKVNYGKDGRPLKSGSYYRYTIRNGAALNAWSQLGLPNVMSDEVLNTTVVKESTGSNIMMTPEQRRLQREADMRIQNEYDNLSVNFGSVIPGTTLTTVNRVARWGREAYKPTLDNILNKQPSGREAKASGVVTRIQIETGNKKPLQGWAYQKAKALGFGIGRKTASGKYVYQRSYDQGFLEAAKRGNFEYFGVGDTVSDAVEPEVVLHDFNGAGNYEGQQAFRMGILPLEGANAFVSQTTGIPNLSDIGIMVLVPNDELRQANRSNKAAQNYRGAQKANGWKSSTQNPPVNIPGSWMWHEFTMDAWKKNGGPSMSASELIKEALSASTVNSFASSMDIFQNLTRVPVLIESVAEPGQVWDGYKYANGLVTYAEGDELASGDVYYVDTTSKKEVYNPKTPKGVSLLSLLEKESYYLVKYSDLPDEVQVNADQFDNLIADEKVVSIKDAKTGKEINVKQARQDNTANNLSNTRNGIIVEYYTGDADKGTALVSVGLPALSDYIIAIGFYDNGSLKIDWDSRVKQIKDARTGDVLYDSKTKNIDKATGKQNFGWRGDVWVKYRGEDVLQPYLNGILGSYATNIDSKGHVAFSPQEVEYITVDGKSGKIYERGKGWSTDAESLKFAREIANDINYDSKFNTEDNIYANNEAPNPDETDAVVGKVSRAEAKANIEDYTLKLTNAINANDQQSKSRPHYVYSELAPELNALKASYNYTDKNIELWPGETAKNGTIAIATPAAQRLLQQFKAQLSADQSHFIIKYTDERWSTLGQANINLQFNADAFAIDSQLADSINGLKDGSLVFKIRKDGKSQTFTAKDLLGTEKFNIEDVKSKYLTYIANGSLISIVPTGGLITVSNAAQKAQPQKAKSQKAKADTPAVARLKKERVKLETRIKNNDLKIVELDKAKDSPEIIAKKNALKKDNESAYSRLFKINQSINAQTKVKAVSKARTIVDSVGKVSPAEYKPEPQPSKYEFGKEKPKTEDKAAEQNKYQFDVNTNNLVDTEGQLISADISERLKDNIGGRTSEGEVEIYTLAKNKASNGILLDKALADATLSDKKYVDVARPLVINGKYASKLYPGDSSLVIDAVADALALTPEEVLSQIRKTDVVNEGTANFSQETINRYRTNNKLGAEVTDDIIVQRLNADLNRNTPGSDLLNAIVSGSSEARPIYISDAINNFARLLNVQDTAAFSSSIAQAMGFDGVEFDDGILVFNKDQIISVGQLADAPNPELDMLAFATKKGKPDIRSLFEDANAPKNEAEIGRKSPKKNAEGINVPDNSALSKTFEKMIREDKPTPELIDNYIKEARENGFGIHQVIHNETEANKAIEKQQSYNKDYDTEFVDWKSQLDKHYMWTTEGQAWTLAFANELVNAIDAEHRAGNDGRAAELIKMNTEVMNHWLSANTEAAQTLQYARMLGLTTSTPAGLQNYITSWLRTMEQIINKGNIHAHISLSLNDLSPEIVADLTSTDEAAKLKAWDALTSYVALKTPKTLLNKVMTYRKIAMLTAPPTFIRNTASNIANEVNVRTKGLLNGILEDVYSKSKLNTGKFKLDQRNFSVRSGISAEVKAQDKSWAKEYSHSTQIIERAEANGTKYQDSYSSAKRKTKGTLDQMYRSKVSAFDSKLMNKVSDVISDTLQNSDTYGMAGTPGLNKLVKSEFGGWLSNFEYALTQMMWANGWTSEYFKSGTEDAINDLNACTEFAVTEADKATYHIKSWEAELINKAKNMNPVAYAVIDTILPFVKTPINIVKAALQYNPMSFVKAGQELADIAIKGEYSTYTMNSVIDRIGSGLTGSAIMLLGMLLAKAGFLNGAGDEDEGKREDAYNTMQGRQKYSINIAGVGTYTLDWMTPTAMTLFMGVELYKLLFDSNDDVDMDTKENIVADVLNALSTTAVKSLGPMLEMSFMSSISDMIDAAKYEDDNAMKIKAVFESGARSYTSSFIPTVFSKVKNSVDSTVYSTYAPKDSNAIGGQSGEQTVRQIINKVPGLNQTNELLNEVFGTKLKVNSPAVDVWGEKKTNDLGNIVANTAYSMLSPGYFRPYKYEERTALLEELKEQTGSDTVYLKVPVKNFTIATENGKEKFIYDNNEYYEASVIAGQAKASAVDDCLASDLFAKLTDEQKAKTLSAINSYGDHAAEYAYTQKNNIKWAVDSKGDYMSDIPKEVESVQDAIDTGLSVGEYFAIKSALSSYTGTGSASKKKAYLRAAGLSYKQREIFGY